MAGSSLIILLLLLCVFKVVKDFFHLAELTLGQEVVHIRYWLLLIQVFVDVLFLQELS